MLKIPKKIARDTRLSSGSRLIYGELMDFGEISVDELAVIYKISKKTLTRRINQLVKYGYIQYEYICKKRPKLMIIKSGQNCPYGMGKDVQKEDQKEDLKKEFVEKEKEKKSSKKKEKDLDINKYIYYINNPNKTKYINKLNRKKINSSTCLKEKVEKKKSNEKIEMKDGKIESGIGTQNRNSDYEHRNGPNFDENVSKVKLPSEEKKIEKNGVRMKKNEMELINLVNQYTKNTDLVLSILEFIRMRSVIKKPLTKHALELSLRKLESLSTDDEIKKQIVDRSIEMCWMSFFPLSSPDWKTKENSKKTKENNDHNAYVIE